MVQYSLLTSDRKVLLQQERIDSMLNDGIKIIAFCSDEIRSKLQINRDKYIKIRLLSINVVQSSIPSIRIDDGKMDNQLEKSLSQISLLAPSFNYEQYIIEHSDANNSLLVEAGAGTGKTTVMIDRVMFLVHTVPNLSLEDIGMITFTNEATWNMKKKIRDVLMQRYSVTQSPKYIKLLEDGSKIKVQTIHSFSKDMISELGSSIGYGQDLKIRGLKHEKRQMIHDMLNDLYLNGSTSKKINSSLGGTLYELRMIIDNFWMQLENIGLSDDEILALDWGSAESERSKHLHKTLCSSFINLNERYNAYKMENDSITVGDIVRELRKVLDKGKNLSLKTHSLKYLFVDEFQDSDNVQIKTIAWLHRSSNLKLFVVGDSKQSIYRFRGALETSFEKLRSAIMEHSLVSPSEFVLTRNYRTSKYILDTLDPMFRRWEQKGLLSYGNRLVPQNIIKGTCMSHSVRKSKDVFKEETVKLIRDALEDCMSNSKMQGDENSATSRVTVLTRTNYQLQEIREWCADAQIPCYVKQEGTFYDSLAVRDFYSMIKAFIFPSQSDHLFDYINSSYSHKNCLINEVSRFEPDSLELKEHLQSKLTALGWEKYQRDFRLRPALSVIREIVGVSNPVVQFASKRKAHLQSIGWKDVDIEEMVSIEAAQFSANTEKLLGILRKNFTNDIVSLYNIYQFVQLSILTNREEDEADISEYMGSGFVQGMTVHKAKGMEFDTVLIPLTHREYRDIYRTEILVDQSTIPYRVAWSHVNKKSHPPNSHTDHKFNSYYHTIVKKEMHDVDREEARLLYVALTRAIRRLEFFVIGNSQHSWAHLLEGKHE